MYHISIHALLAESDKPGEHHANSQQEFLSTLSLRRATREKTEKWSRDLHFYPRSPCGERLIHPLLCNAKLNFYPRSPCGERHVPNFTRKAKPYFYPRSPCGERRASSQRERQGQRISIHALLAESDICECWTAPSRPLFLSTLSLRRATVHYDNYNLHCVISIHALLAESDKPGEHHANSQQEFLSTLSLRRATMSCAWSASKLGDFYPRSPCGERLFITTTTICTASFLSTLSLRRATTILINTCQYFFYFYPRSPCGERHTIHIRTCQYFLISIHALLAESDNQPGKSNKLTGVFLSTLSLRRATIEPIFSKIDTRNFYPRSPCGERQ